MKHLLLPGGVATPGIRTMIGRIPRGEQPEQEERFTNPHRHLPHNSTRGCREEMRYNRRFAVLTGDHAPHLCFPVQWMLPAILGSLNTRTLPANRVKVHTRPPLVTGLSGLPPMAFPDPAHTTILSLLAAPRTPSPFEVDKHRSLAILSSPASRCLAINKTCWGHEKVSRCRHQMGVHDEKLPIGRIGTFPSHDWHCAQHPTVQYTVDAL